MSMIFNILQVTPSELEEYKQDSSKLEDRVYSQDSDDPQLTDLDKAWDGIMFVLKAPDSAQSSSDLSNILFSGQLIDEEQDMGYGPAHFLTAEQVAAYSLLISAITENDVQQRFDPQKMTELELYPTIWDEGDEALDYVMEYFQTLQHVLSEAAENNQAIITFLN